MTFKNPPTVMEQKSATATVPFYGRSISGLSDSATTAAICLQPRKGRNGRTEGRKAGCAVRLVVWFEMWPLLLGYGFMSEQLSELISMCLWVTQAPYLLEVISEETKSLDEPWETRSS